MVVRLMAVLAAVASLVSTVLRFFSTRKSQKAVPADAPIRDPTMFKWIRALPRGSIVDCLDSELATELERIDEVGEAIESQLTSRHEAAAAGLRKALAASPAADRQLSALHCLLGHSEMRLGSLSTALDECEVARTLAVRASDRTALACALLGIGEVEGRIGLLDRAIQHLKDAHSTFRQTGSQVGLSRSACELARLLHMQGDYRRAHAYAEEARRLAEAAASPRLRGDAQHIEGCLHRDEGDPTSALAHLRSAASLHSQIDDQLAYADDMRNIGFCHLHTGDLVTGEQELQEAMRIYQTHDEKWGGALCEISLATIQSRRGNHDVALARYSSAQELSRQADNRWGEALATGNIGAVHILLGDLASAEQVLREALVLHQQIHDEWGAAGVQNNLAVIQLWRGNFRESLDSFRVVRSAYRKIGYPQGEGGTLINMALAETELEDYSLAEVYLENALQITKSAGDQLSTAIAMNNAGEVSLELGKYDAARTAFAKALRLFTEMGCEPHGAQAASNLSAVYLASGAVAQGETMHAQAVQQLRRAGEVIPYADALVRYSYFHPVLPPKAKLSLAEEALDIYEEKGVEGRWKARAQDIADCPAEES